MQEYQPISNSMVYNDQAAFNLSFFFFLKIDLSIYDRQRERQRHRREKQAPCQEPDVGLDPGTPGSRPGPKAGAKPLSHPGIPAFNHFENHVLTTRTTAAKSKARSKILGELHGRGKKG